MFTRPTNAFSKEVENLKAAPALHFVHYNLVFDGPSTIPFRAVPAVTTRHLALWLTVIERRVATKKSPSLLLKVTSIGGQWEGAFFKAPLPPEIFFA